MAKRKAAAGKTVSGVKFSSFKFTNKNSVDGEVLLEAPIGKLIGTFKVKMGKTIDIDPGVSDVKSVRMEAGFDKDHDDDQSIELTGKPFGAFVTAVTAEWIVGSIHGTIDAGF
jgi:hypothetical protein